MSPAGTEPDDSRLVERGAALEVSRSRGEGGMLLFVNSTDSGTTQDALEHVARSFAMTRLAAGVSHDIRNPLNAMALQIALLSEKLSSAGGEAVNAAMGHLGSLRDQIARVNEVLRRFLEVTEPAAPFGYVDLGSLLADLAGLLGHEARQRGIELVLGPPPGPVRSSADPSRTGRLLLGLFGRTLAETPDGTRLVARTFTDGDEAAVRWEHPRGPTLPELAGLPEVVSRSAAAMGGRLLIQQTPEAEAVELRLPKHVHP
jgi:signal transduction histidine kinase